MSLLEVGTMKAVLIAVGVGFVVLYAGLCMYLYLMQRSFIYFPTPPSRGVAAEELAIESEGATLQVWRLHGDRPDAILYFGGNAEDVAGNVAEFREWFPRHAIYLVNYRGYGGSSGTPTEAGLYRDAEAVFDVARAQHGRIAVIGRSLGAGVATHLASVRPLDRVALVSPPAASRLWLSRSIRLCPPNGYCETGSTRSRGQSGSKPPS